MWLEWDSDSDDCDWGDSEEEDNQQTLRHADLNLWSQFKLLNFDILIILVTNLTHDFKSKLILILWTNINCAYKIDYKLIFLFICVRVCIHFFHF